MTFISSEPIDLDDLLKQFIDWQEINSNIRRKNVCLEEQVKQQCKALAEAEDAYKQLQNKLSQQINLTELIQENFKKKCDIEDENRIWKAQIELEKQELQKKLQEHEKEIEKFNILISTIKSENEEKLARQENESKAAADTESERLHQLLDEQRACVETLRRELQAAQKEKMAEAVRIRCEFDNKLLMVQKQNAKSQSTSHGPSVDIYRKKLAHLRAESEQEISQLQQRVRELEQQLDKQQHLAPAPPKQQRPRDTLSVTRTKRFYQTGRSKDSR